MFSPRRSSRGFTLLELVVVVVVLAVLAAVAIPTFRGVIERSQDEAAVTSLSGYAREVQSLAAFSSTGFTPDDFEAAALDMTAIALPGTYASAVDARGGLSPLGQVEAQREGDAPERNVQPAGRVPPVEPSLW